MHSDTHFRLAEHLALTEVDSEMVLLDLDSGSYYGLNHVGAALLKGIQANESLEQSTRRIATLYGRDPAEVRQDLEQLLAQLIEQKLLSVEHTAAK